MSYFFSILLPYMKNERHLRLVSKEWNQMFDEYILAFYDRPLSIFREILLQHKYLLYFSECYYCMYSLCYQKQEWFILLILHLICKTFSFPVDTALKVSRLCNDICLYLNRIKNNKNFIFRFVYERVLASQSHKVKKRKRGQIGISTGISRLSSKRITVV